MKILRVLPSMDYGGIERGVYDFSLTAAKAGHQIIIASGNGRFIPPLLANGIRWYDVPMDRKNPATFIRATKTLQEIISREKPDVIHAQSRFPCWIVHHVLKYGRHVPFVTSIHSFCPFRLYTRSLGKGDRVIVVSKILGEYAARFLRIPEEKIRLVYNGVSVDDFFSEKQEEHAIPVIGMISRFTASKGQVLFIEAIHMLIRDRFNINGLIVGSGSPSQRGKIERQIAAKALEKCIAIVSEDSRIALKKIDILVVPSVEPEGFGRTVVEAQMAGVPVVATGIGAIPELIEHGRTGFLVRPRNPADIADAVKWIISNPSETKMIVENARENALSRFTVERMVSGILEVYQEAIALKNS